MHIFPDDCLSGPAVCVARQAETVQHPSRGQQWALRAEALELKTAGTGETVLLWQRFCILHCSRQCPRHVVGGAAAGSGFRV